MQHITEWNKAWWNLEIESFESFLLNGDEQVEKWKNFKVAHKKAASAWSFTFGLTGNQLPPDIDSKISSKEGRRLNKIILKPTKSKIIISWLVMSLIVYIFIILFNWREITDLFSLTLVTLVLMIQCFIFNIIFYNLPYFKIEINDTHLVGPRGLGGGWQRTQILLQDVDMQKTSSGLRWLGFYIIRSNTGDKLSVWGFDEKQFNKLADLIKSKQVN